MHSTTGKERGSARAAEDVMAKKNKRKKRVSCLGVLLILFMLAIAACTISINLLFRNGNAPQFFGNRYCYYTREDMGERVPAGSLIIVEETSHIEMQNIVLYRNADEYRIAVASLIVDTDSNVPEQTGKTYYLTTVTNTTAVQAEEDAIIGICTYRSPELGVIIGFLTGTIGLIVGLVLPCVILLLYMVAVIAKGKNDENEFADDEDNDLEFVKSIQQKQQRIAQMDAARQERERKKVQTFDDDFYDDYDNADEPEEHSKQYLTDEELAQMEEEEAARRAERIAAVRSHMEQRRQTETPDGVPLYTTEIITKTHTLSIPKVGDKPLTTAQNPLMPTPKEDIPRLTATGHLQIPTAEEIEAEQLAQENRFKAAQELAKAAQNDFFYDAPKAKADEPAPERERNSAVTAAADDLIAEILKEKPQQPDETPEAPVAEEVSAPIEEPPAPAAKPAEIAEETPAAAAAPAPKLAKKSRKPQIASSSFDDLMAFISNEQKKL